METSFYSRLFPWTGGVAEKFPFGKFFYSTKEKTGGRSSGRGPLVNFQTGLDEKRGSLDKGF